MFVFVLETRGDRLRVLPILPSPLGCALDYPILKSPEVTLSKIGSVVDPYPPPLLKAVTGA